MGENFARAWSLQRFLAADQSLSCGCLCYITRQVWIRFGREHSSLQTSLLEVNHEIKLSRIKVGIQLDTKKSAAIPVQYMISQDITIFRFGCFVIKKMYRDSAD